MHCRHESFPVASVPVRFLDAKRLLFKPSWSQARDEMLTGAEFDTWLGSFCTIPRNSTASEAMDSPNSWHFFARMLLRFKATPYLLK